MPYISEKELAKYQAQSEAIKARYKKGNENSKKYYDRISVAIPKKLYKDFCIACNEMNTSKNGTINDLIREFVNKYYEL